MGPKTEKVVRVVLDTNILVSALLFKGELNVLHSLWKEKRFVPYLSQATFQELQRVLTYPKFNLSERELTFIIREELLPYFEIIEICRKIKRTSSDPDDDKFIECALSAGLSYIVTGDSDLLSVKEYENIRIISPAEFLKIIN